VPHITRSLLEALICLSKMLEDEERGKAIARAKELAARGYSRSALRRTIQDEFHSVSVFDALNIADDAFDASQKDRRVMLQVEIGDESFTASLEDFLRDNADSFDAEQVQAIRTLKVGDSKYEGGGAAPAITVKRIK